MRNFTLRRKFALAFVCLAILVAASLSSIRYMGKSAEAFLTERQHRVLMLQTRAALDAVKFGTPLASQVTRASLLQAFSAARELSQQGIDLVTWFEREFLLSLAVREPLRLASLDISYQETMQRLVETEPGTAITPALLQKLDAVMAKQFELEKENIQALRRGVAITKISSTTMLIIALAGLVWSLALVRRSVLPPLSAALDFANRVASGDLSGSVGTTKRDEMGQFMTALQSMNDALAFIVRDVRDSSAAVAEAAREVATGSAELGDRTDRQAATLQQTAASTHQLEAAIASNVNQVRQARDLADRSSSLAKESGTAVASTVEVMRSIDSASRHVADIVGLIDGIAFQTNILALNAGVEAARAGAHGLGFAVVAQEVRQLAQRSTSAAKEIQTLIQASSETATTGLGLAEDAGRKMQSTVDSISEVAGLMNSITNTSREQASDALQVRQALSQLEDLAQQNAVMVGRATAAAQSQASHAQELLQLVSRFKLVAAKQVFHQSETAHTGALGRLPSRKR